MPRLYETVGEQKARELRALNAGTTAAPATIPPPRAARRSPNPHERKMRTYLTNEDLIVFPYQSKEDEGRRIANASLQLYRAFVRATGRLS